MNNLEGVNVSTPLGEFHMIVCTQRGRNIVQASGFGDVLALQKRLPASLAHLELRKAANDHPYALRIREYFEGNLTALNDIPYDKQEVRFIKKYGGQ